MATERARAAAVGSADEDSAETAPLHEQIAALAFSLWEARGCPHGNPEEDWFNAEAQLTQTAEE
jgi:hypothetical protein